MNHKQALTVVTVASVVTLAGCSSTPEPSFEEGWQWGLRSDAAWDIDADFDYFTGEISYEGEDTGTGLSLASTATPEDDELETAMVEAEQDKCERYVDPYGSDPLVSQGYDIQILLLNSVRAAVAPTYSDDYLAASDAVSAWVDDNGPSTEGIEITSDEWDEVNDERNALAEQHWQDEYPDLMDERQSYMDDWDSLRIDMYTTEKVRDAQNFIIDACGIDVAEDYDFPTPSELGITVDEEYAKGIEEANA